METPQDWKFDKDSWTPTTEDMNANAEAGVIVMQMMTGHGDVRKIWNAANSDEVEDARRSFNHLVKDKKYAAFRVNPDTNEKAEQIREFDPEAGKMILVPPMRGG